MSAARITIDLDSIALSSGGHDSPDEGHCLLEVVSMFVGEDFGDSPACVDPVLAAFGRSWNDGMRTNAERDQLKRYITLLPGTNVSDTLSLKRSYMALDWLFRTYAPAWLDLTESLKPHAAALRGGGPVVDAASLGALRPLMAAARAAARAAAGAAAGDAAWAAAWAAAGAAAGDAAWDALEPTVKTLQASAHELLTAMINAELREVAEGAKP